MLACLFDLDGTLLDTLDDLAYAVNTALADHGFPTHDRATIKSFVGNGVGRLVLRAAPEGISPDLQTSVLDRFLEVYDQEMTRRTKPYPGIVDLLETLHLSGVPLGVFSNKVHHATLHLCDHFFPGVFQGVLGHKPENPLKPAPEGLYQLLRDMDLAPGHCLYLGDTPVDLALGRAADLPVLACTWGFAGRHKLEEEGAQHLISVPEEALPYILSPSAKKG